MSLLNYSDAIVAHDDMRKHADDAVVRGLVSVGPEAIADRPSATDPLVLFNSLLALIVAVPDRGFDDQFRPERHHGREVLQRRFGNRPDAAEVEVRRQRRPRRAARSELLHRFLVEVVKTLSIRHAMSPFTRGRDGDVEFPSKLEVKRARRDTFAN